jgi:hypothetical protein
MAATFKSFVSTYDFSRADNQLNRRGLDDLRENSPRPIFKRKTEGAAAFRLLKIPA